MHGFPPCKDGGEWGGGQNKGEQTQEKELLSWK